MLVFWRNNVKLHHKVNLVLLVGFLLTGFGCAATQEVVKVVEAKAPPPITGRFMQMPKEPICLDAGKKEYEVKELETATSCYRDDAARARDNLRLLQAAVKAREAK